jgi:hypothetical protein
VVRDSLKALDPKRPIREADISRRMRAVAIYEYAPWTATSPARPLTEIVVCRVSLWHRGDFHGENVGGLLPTGLTIESSSGERSFIN